jgi:hypothetical protein
VLRTTSHNGFPVIKKKSESRTKTYVGFMLRKQLMLLLDQQKYYPKDLPRPPQVIDYGTYIHLMNLKFSEKDLLLPPPSELKDFIVDVTPCILLKKFHVNFLSFLRNFYFYSIFILKLCWKKKFSFRENF